MFRWDLKFYDCRVIYATWPRDGPFRDLRGTSVDVRVETFYFSLSFEPDTDQCWAVMYRDVGRTVRPTVRDRNELVGRFETIVENEMTSRSRGLGNEPAAGSDAVFRRPGVRGHVDNCRINSDLRPLSGRRVTLRSQPAGRRKGISVEFV